MLFLQLVLLGISREVWESHESDGFDGWGNGRLAMMAATGSNGGKALCDGISRMRYLRSGGGTVAGRRCGGWGGAST
ncbi:hypothetical protein L484_015242 [Morus notabilis]|uniref:Uncharacterized protein n=1 Tax=Morus notabilis TaxID=981085 RepID=W9RUU3_9ROSA|nr:hypothetical protein L484_015242 [Morus notabilis]